MIPYGRQDINEEDVQAVTEALRSDWLTTGPIVERFEQALQEWTGGTPTVAVSSGTAALHAAYAAAGLGAGDEVITPPITFAATQAALVHLGAVPVFADVDPDSALISPDAVESMIGPRTAAVVAVDYAGHPADMDALRIICDRHKVLLIEDAAHSLGSTYRGRHVGELADLTTFSFFPTKNITSGEGGAVASPHPDLLAKARRFSRQGLVRESEEFALSPDGPWHQEVHEVGLNYRLTDLQAALGTSQLAKLGYFKEVRSRIKRFYDNCFSELEGIDVPVQFPGVEPMWHLYPMRVPAARRLQIYSDLRAAGVGVQVNYVPAYRHPALAHFGNGMDFPASELFYARELSLPMHTRLTPADLEYVAAAVLCAMTGPKGKA